ncbi:hypothetical protein [Taklimakanibacter albus]|uniref:Uncharacterized protein n=1 Tax=Taklimakanibacter albus TaxID=2800327 RepID=A0ACC5RGC1_9HYPH|nr:hypothetical protein [Aestuariivirga sp. YIM B02566]MBK1871566.1 hypothetical protein [Aestuariivirga sp. YIM B02566]
MATKKSGPLDVETAIGTDSSVSLSMGDPENPDAVAETNDEAGLGVDAGLKKDKKEVPDERPEDTEEDSGGDLEEGSEGQDGEGDDADGDGEGDKEAAQDPATKPLGKFDAKDVAKWDTRYQKDGKFNMDVLSSEFDRNIKDGVGQLDDGTYDYLASKGWPKEDVKAIEAALVEQRKAFWTGTIAKVGGKELLDAAVKWGREGGYSKEQQARFNATLKGSDSAAIEEALELVITRYQKSNTKGGKTFNSSDKPNRGGGAGGDIYKTKDDWKADQKKIKDIRDAGKRQQEHNRVREKLKRSQKHWK